MFVIVNYSACELYIFLEMNNLSKSLFLKLMQIVT